MAQKELRVIDAEMERVDLIGCYQWCLAESGITQGYQVGVKAYSNLPHGQNQDAIESYVAISDLRSAVTNFRREVAKDVGWSAWSTAISSVLVDEDNVPRLFIPVIDLEIDATENPENDLGVLDYHLLSIGCTGTFLRSGDIGSGSYFFVGDSVWPYEPGFREFFGLLMVALLDWQNQSEEAKSNRRQSMAFGEKILCCQDSHQAREVAKQILLEFPSISSGQRRAGLELDPRWAARRFIEEKTYLRYTPGKGYEDKPLVIAELY